MHPENKDRFEELMNKRLWNLEAEPSEALWKNINKKIPSTPSVDTTNLLWKGGKLYSIIVAGIVISALTIWYLSANKVDQNDIAQKKVLSGGQTDRPLDIHEKENIVVVKEKEDGNVRPDAVSKAGDSDVRQVDGNLKDDRTNIMTSEKISEITADQGVFSHHQHEITTNAVADSVIHVSGVNNKIKTDSVTLESKPKSFYEKQLKDTTIRARKLFK